MDYLMKYIDYSDLNTSRMVLGSICSMLRKHKDYMLKYKDKFEKLEQTSTVPQVKDTAHDIILVLEGKRYKYSKTWVKRSLKKTKIAFQDQLSLNAGQKYCRMLQWEHSAILFHLH